MKNSCVQVQDKHLCCGCEGCANACPKDAITFAEDEYGFIYPLVDKDVCIDCGKCVKVCPILGEEKNKERPIRAYAAVNKAISVLQQSSSGGVFSAVAGYVLGRGGAVCGCVLDEKLRAIHICTEKETDIVRMRGSKYVQSNIGNVFREVAERIKNGQMVLFTGTPCQVAALYSVLGNKACENLITMDLVCHGVPSARMFKKYIEYLEKKHHKKIVKFKFRNKKYGWQRWTTSYIDEDGREKNLGKTSEFYIPSFTGGNIMRPSCFTCKFACPERVGDITVGDFWGHEKINLACNTEQGVSICTLNTDKAISLFQYLSEHLFLQEIDYNIAVKGNRCLHKPTEKGDKWDLYMDALKNDNIKNVAERYIKKNKKKILREKLKMFVPYKIFTLIRKKKYGQKDVG